ncbi:MAG: AAA family ATPase [SAR324 cluster bacterium]|nr:AAA family ATPase [SAR324 cluster bacterium]
MKITLAGVPGSGKSTLRHVLAKQFDLKVKGTGDFMRAIAQKHGFNDITKFLVEYVSRHPEVDHEVDEAQRKYGQENQDFVLDAHLGFFFVPDSIKIFLDCDPKEMANRILNAKRETEAAKDMKASMEANQKRIQTMRQNFKKLYNVDMHDQANFDFILDTTHLGPEEVAQKVIEFINSRTP